MVAVVIVDRATTAHLDKRMVVAAAANAALGKDADLAVLHVVVAGRADHVGLLEALEAEFVVIVGVAKKGPIKLELGGALGPDLFGFQDISDLGEQRAGKDTAGSNDVTVANLVAPTGKRQIFQLQGIADLLAEPGALVTLRDDIAVVTIGLDVGSGVAAKLIGRARSLLGRTMEAERRRQLMQQPGVIAIPVILVIELPITGEALAAMAEQDDRFGKQAIEKLANRNIEEIVERFSRGVEGPENHAPIARHAKLLQGVGAAVKVFRHAANSGDPAFKRDPNQITAEVVAPVVMTTQAQVRTEVVWFNFAPDRVHWASYAGRNFTDRQRIKRKAANWGRRYKALPAGERLAVLAAMMAVDAEDP